MATSTKDKAKADAKSTKAADTKKAEGGANPNDPVTKAVTLPEARSAEASNVDPLIVTDGITPAEADRTKPPLNDAEAQAQAGATPPEHVEPAAAPNYDEVDPSKDFKRIAEDAVRNYQRGLLARELRRADTDLRQTIGYALGYDVTGVHQVRLEVVEESDGKVVVKAKHRPDDKWITLNID